MAFAFGIIQTDLAKATGMTSIHVNRTLRSLRNEGIMSVRGGEVTILDWTALVRIGEFDPGYLMLDKPPLRLIAAHF